MFIAQNLTLTTDYQPCGNSCSITSALTMHNEEAIEQRETQASNWLASVSGDVHFWVPTLVLIGGLLLLRWVS